MPCNTSKPILPPTTSLHVTHRSHRVVHWAHRWEEDIRETESSHSGQSWGCTLSGTGVPLSVCVWGDLQRTPKNSVTIYSLVQGGFPLILEIVFASQMHPKPPQCTYLIQALIHCTARLNTWHWGYKSFMSPHYHALAVYMHSTLKWLKQHSTESPLL